MPTELYVVCISLALILAGAFLYFLSALATSSGQKGMYAGLTLGCALVGFLFTIPFGATDWLWVTILAGGYYAFTLLVAIVYILVSEQSSQDS